MDSNNNDNKSYPQYEQHNPPTPSNVSKGELFVGINLLSKIGIIFIIIGVIAFSAASEEILPGFVRMGMVLAVGVIMVIGGELFRKTRSVVFANALTYGGIAELFISTLIGRFELKVWEGTAAQIVGLAAAAAGIFLSLRYKSQPLLVVTQVGASLPLFAAGDDFTSTAAAAACLMAIHAGTAIIARRRSLAASYITGICLAFVHSITIMAQTNNAGRMSGLQYNDGNILMPFVLMFVLCTTVCYIGGLLLNAAEREGRMNDWETAGTIICLANAVLMINVLFATSNDNIKITGIVNIVTAVLLAVFAVCFAVRYKVRCTAVGAIANGIIVCLALSVFMLMDGVAAIYIALHVFAVAIFSVGLRLKWKLLTGWGFALLGVSECVFLGVLFQDGAVRMVGIIVNLVVWFAVMAAYILFTKHDTMGFKLYTCLAFLNAGLLGSSLVVSDLTPVLDEGGFSTAECFLVGALGCACLWLALGYAVGKVKFLGSLGMGASIAFYLIGLCCLFTANMVSWAANINDSKFGLISVLLTIFINIESVLAVLDFSLQLGKKSPKFAKAVGLVVSAYSLASLTSVLGMNNMVAFTSWFISIIYIATAAIWIILGFTKRNTLLRRCGLVLVLLSCAKLFLFDFSGMSSMVRTLLFIGFGITLLAISFGYGIAEKKLKDEEK